MMNRFVTLAVGGLCTLTGGCATPQAATATQSEVCALPTSLPPGDTDLSMRKPVFEFRLVKNFDPHMTAVLNEPSHVVLDGIELVDLLAMAYGVTPQQVKGVRGSRNARLGYEIIGPGASKVNLSSLLQAALPASFGLQAEVRTEKADVIVVKQGSSPPRLKPSVGGQPGGVYGQDKWEVSGVTAAGIADILATHMNRIVIDETGLGGPYDAAVSLPEGTDWRSDEGLRLIGEQLGLSVTREKREVRMVQVTWPKRTAQEH